MTRSDWLIILGTHGITLAIVAISWLDIRQLEHRMDRRKHVEANHARRLTALANTLARPPDHTWEPMPIIDPNRPVLGPDGILRPRVPPSALDGIDNDTLTSTGPIRVDPLLLAIAGSERALTAPELADLLGEDVPTVRARLVGLWQQHAVEMVPTHTAGENGYRLADPTVRMADARQEHAR